MENSQSNVAEVMGLSQDEDVEEIQKIVKAESAISFGRFVQGIIQHITIQPDSIEIKLNVEELCSAFREVTGIKIHSPKEMALIKGVYNTRRGKKSALVIEQEKPDRDIFDLPPDQLKKFVQGFIWRDEHFQGHTIRQIAAREGLSDSYVGKQIFATFEVDQAVT